MRARHVIGEVQRRRSRAEAEQLVAGFEASGLRRREFCLKQGVALSTLDFWRKRRRQERGAIASSRLGTPNADARAKVGNGDRLVAVELADLPVGAVGGGLAVVVSRGRRIDVSRGFDAATLERLLAVLEQA